MESQIKDFDPELKQKISKEVKKIIKSSRKEQVKTLEEMVKKVRRMWIREEI